MAAAYRSNQGSRTRTSSPGSTKASTVATMASEAPVVTTTSVSGSHANPYHASWCAQIALRSSGSPCAGGYCAPRPSAMAANAASRTSAGPSVSGNP